MTTNAFVANGFPVDERGVPIKPTEYKKLGIELRKRVLVRSSASEHEVEAARSGFVAGCCGPANVLADA